MKLVEVAAWISSGGESRCRPWVRHATVIAARSLGLYERGRQYSDREAKAIRAEVARLFPPRGTE